MIRRHRESGCGVRFGLHEKVVFLNGIHVMKTDVVEKPFVVITNES